MWYIHTIEYYSAIKGNEILIYVPTWMDLESIKFSEISETRKDKYCMIPLIWGTKNRQIHRESRLEITRNWGKRELLLNGYRVFVGDDGKALDIDSNDGYTTLWMHSMSLNCTLYKWFKCEICYLYFTTIKKIRCRKVCSMLTFV